MCAFEHCFHRSGKRHIERRHGEQAKAAGIAPLQGIGIQRGRLTVPAPAAVKPDDNAGFGIGRLGQIGNCIAIQHQAKLFCNFALQGLKVGFARFNLATGEFPQPTVGTIRAAALHQHLALCIDQGCGDHVNHCRIILQIAACLKRLIRDVPITCMASCHNQRSWGTMKATLQRLVRDQRGTSAVEMGLICALIVLAMLTALQGVANQTQATWNTVSSKSAEAVAGSTAA